MDARILWKMNMAAFMTMSVLAAQSAGTESRLEYYQKEIAPKPAGVYENGRDLYIQSRVSLKKSESTLQGKKRAVSAANDLLRNWVMQQSASARTNVVGVAPGLLAAMRWLDVASPTWRLSGWNYKADGQEFAIGRKDGAYVLGQVVEKDAVLERMPAALSLAAPTNDVMRVLRFVMPRALAADRARTYALCGTLDLAGCAATNVSAEAQAEFARADQLVADYMARHAHPAEVRKQADALRTPVLAESWNERALEPVTVTREIVVVTTNAIVGAEVETNGVERAQTQDERKLRGVAEKGMLQEELRSFDQEEVVETKTVTLVTTTRRIRRKTEKSAVGRPRFEELFLTGGKEKQNARLAQTAAGEEAKRNYLSGTGSFETKEAQVRAALGENPGDETLWNMYGRCRLTRGDAAGALSCFRNAAVLAPNDQFVLVNLAEAYEALGCPTLARGYAVLARGLVEDAWCVGRTEALLLKK